MALKHVSTILEQAYRKKTAVMCFECVNYEQIMWCIESAEEAEQPVVLMLYYDMTFYTSTSAFIAMAKAVAEAARIPVGLTYVYADEMELVMAAVKDGFPSVCYNPKGDTLQEKIDSTRAVVEAAGAYGVDIAASPGEYGQVTAREAVRFAKESGIAALVAPVVYGHSDNNLNFTELRHWYETNVDLIDEEMLREIHQSLDMPLIIHRANNLSAEEKRKAMGEGVTKFDNGCPMDTAFYRAVKDIAENVDCGESYFALLMEMKERVKRYAFDCIRQLN